METFLFAMMMMMGVVVVVRRLKPACRGELWPAHALLLAVPKQRLQWQ